MRRLYQAANLPEAHLLVQLLAQARIEARVFNEHAQGGLGELPFTVTYPEVWIMEDADLERAQGILAAYEAAERSAPPWPCRHCGEQNPGSFELCWRCAEPRA